ncbi:MAG: peptidylprolyl isomerase [Armatimonadetes bacterium]|nr:peptidylprolyl isomerase [Armatimonadota bacterium]
MIATILAMMTLADPAHQMVGEYNPSGPKIVFTMKGGSQFVIATDPVNSPLTTAHILDLVRRGFYNGQRVHRVEWWVTQFGAPASKYEDLDVKGPDGKMMLNEKIGDGGSGKSVPFERSEVEFVRGVVGIASEGLQKGGDSQIFILRQDARRLDFSYAALGKVVSGMDVVGGIRRGDRIISAVVQGEAVKGKKK